MAAESSHAQAGASSSSRNKHLEPTLEDLDGDEGADLSLDNALLADDLLASDEDRPQYISQVLLSARCSLFCQKHLQEEAETTSFPRHPQIPPDSGTIECILQECQPPYPEHWIHSYSSESPPTRVVKQRLRQIFTPEQRSHC